MQQLPYTITLDAPYHYGQDGIAFINQLDHQNKMHERTQYQSLVLHSFTVLITQAIRIHQEIAR